MTQAFIPAPPQTGGGLGYLRIATEEAFAPRELIQLYLKLLERDAIDDPGFRSFWGFYGRDPNARAQVILEALQDLGEKRIADMDARGIDKQVIALTAPGVQPLHRDLAVEMAVFANDRLAEACRRAPDRLVGMTAIAPQDPVHSVREMERGVRELGFKAVIVNSHTQGEYLDSSKFWPILEAAEALDLPLYLHPNTPPKAMIQPFLEAGLDGAIFGFGVETSLHALRLIMKGVLDRFPNLQVILGHMGEALPFWQYRLDYFQRLLSGSKRYEVLPPLKHAPSEYLKRNFFITSSGMAWEPAIKFTQETVGLDRVLYAMDYPYQCDLEEVVSMDGMAMSLEHKRKFFQTNAERVFKLA